MTIFSKTHQNKSSKEFKQEWKIWINIPEIKTHISETANQNPSHTINTLYDKIYESMRYHRRKTIKTKTPPSTETTATYKNIESNEAEDTKHTKKQQRKKTTSFSQTFIQIIIKHIKQNYEKKPENAYSDFKENHIQDIKQEKQYLISKYDESILYDIDEEHINIHYNKFKRNYKNSFQQYKKIIQKQSIDQTQIL